MHMFGVDSCQWYIYMWEFITKNKMKPPGEMRNNMEITCWGTKEEKQGQEISVKKGEKSTRNKEKMVNKQKEN